MATPSQLTEKARMGLPSPSTSSRVPPQLPPRANTVLSPPPYSPDDPETSKIASMDWQSEDPRRLSTESLYPSKSGPKHRRTLLLVYIHGFMGNEASFQSFPAHVHNLLSDALSETHSVHTKMYPRYKSRKTIEFAREEFSAWYVYLLSNLWIYTYHRANSGCSQTRGMVQILSCWATAWEGSWLQRLP